MATTKIWDVKGWLGKVVIYIENPAKTENPAFYQKADMTETQAQGLTDVIEYAVDSNKTEMQYYVSALNCSTLTARNEMMAVKKTLWERGRDRCFSWIPVFCRRRSDTGYGP